MLDVFILINKCMYGILNGIFSYIPGYICIEKNNNLLEFELLASLYTYKYLQFFELKVAKCTM